MRKNTQGHLLFGSALKLSFRDTGYSQSDVRPTVGHSQDKPKDSPLQKQEGRHTAFLAPHFPKFYTETEKKTPGE